MKRLHQFEDERTSLLQGLEVVQKAAEWYQQQLVDINQRIQQQGGEVSGTIGV